MMIAANGEGGERDRGHVRGHAARSPATTSPYNKAAEHVRRGLRASAKSSLLGGLSQATA